MKIKISLKSKTIKRLKLVVGSCVGKTWVNKIKIKFPKTYKRLLRMSSITDASIPYIFYNTINNISSHPRCECGNKVDFLTFTRGYRKFCSNICAQRSSRTRNKIRKTSLKKYGVENPSQSKKVKNKTRKTMLANNGGFGFGSKKISKKIFKTMKHLHGVENASHSSKLQDKKVVTSIKNHGTNYPSQSDTIKDKTRKTNLKRYGTSCVLNKEKIKRKAKETLKKNYGVENPFASEKVKKKIKKTNLKKYGHENPMKNKEIKNKLGKTNLKRYGFKCSLQNLSVQQKIKKSCIENYGVDNPWKSEKIRKKIKQTNLNRYGVEFVTQNRKILQKAQKSARKSKKIYRHGKTFIYQGWEDLSIDYFIEKGVPVKKIFYRKVPSFKYGINNNSVYMPDLYVRICKVWWIIEVKCPWSIGAIDENKMAWKKFKEKAKSVLREGYKFALMIYRSRKDTKPVIIRIRNIEVFSLTRKGIKKLIG